MVFMKSMGINKLAQMDRIMANLKSRIDVRLCSSPSMLRGGLWEFNQSRGYDIRTWFCAVLRQEDVSPYDNVG